MPIDSLTLEHHQQSRANHCVPACALMVLQFWGIEVDETAVADLLGTSNAGTLAEDLHRLEALHVAVHLGQGTIFDLKRSLRDGIPALVFVETDSLPYWETACFHSVVVAAVDNDGVTVYDPYLDHGPTVVPVVDFLRAWSAYDWEFAVILPSTLSG